ncbi:MAG: S-adenosylmethionine:tRNA ribosyltransferase-isomerase [Bacteroidales bacterium]|nr:S-adenosylmethionine:tRNA ribosyltransferase-isomerase [Bacteroidales bacterium]
MQRSKLIKIADYRYNLPDDRIAKYPLAHRDASKLLIYKAGNIHETIFREVSDILPEKSLMVWNDSRVLNARIIFHKDTGARIEVFCLTPAQEYDYANALTQTETCRWKCIVGNLKKWKQGKLSKSIAIHGKELILQAELIEKTGKNNIVEFSWNHKDIQFGDILEHSGLTPIPPYLNRESELIDRSRYQTVYSENEGSVAAPTAGLHFSPEVLSALNEKQITQKNISLHVGTGTFQPVKSECIGEHPMHTEFFYISKQTVDTLIQHHGNITAVGTTTVRGLESLYQIGVKAMSGLSKLSEPQEITQWEAYENQTQRPAIDILHWISDEMARQKLDAIKGKTSIMIAPGYKFRFINRLITNFHQPGSTLLLLIAAYIGDDWKTVYDFALTNNFRFLSYGDSSLLYPNQEIG